MALEVKNVVSGYSREITILNGVTLSAREGQVTLIIGPNGAGKSTLLRTIYGYLVPRAGEISFDGRVLNGKKPMEMLREGIAYLLQGHSIFPAMTVEENLELGSWIIRSDRIATQSAFAEVYERYPIFKEKRRVPAGVLSGGQQRMLEIARLTMTKPKALLLDEPSVGLMPKLVDEVYAEIAKLKSERLNILIVDQNVRRATEIADYVYVLKLGRNSSEGPQHDFKNQLSNVVKDWL